jgi:predicted DNA-binding transcriptional regulator YafY
LSEEEITALDYSTALLQQLKGSRIFDQFETAINRLIEGYRVSKLIGKSEKQLIQVEEPVATGGNEWLEMILQAIVSQTTLEIEYAKFGAPVKQHLLSPYLIKEYRNRWYVVGFSDAPRKVLILALDRINRIRKSKSPFYSDPTFQAADYFQYSFGITHTAAASPEKIVVTFDKEQAPYILAQPLHHSQVVLSESAKGVTVQLTVYVTAELIMSLLSYGPGVEVKEPLALRKTMQEKIEAMQRVYQ